MPEHIFQILPSGGALGAEIRGLDLSRPLPPDTAARIRRALLDHGVIFFRNQRLTEEDQIRFTRSFGEPVEHVRKQRDRPHKEIFIISNIQENGEPVGALGNDEIKFHSDLSYMPKPGTISILYALELPATGGATWWCSGYAAYDALGEPLKTRLKGTRALHRHPVEAQNPPEPATHPVICTHPETGRKTLYVSPHLTRSIVGLEEPESRRLLEALIAHATQPRFVWTHTWKIGDLVVWDNRCTMHRREPFPPDQRRFMKRTQVFNDEIPRE